MRHPFWRAFLRGASRAFGARYRQRPPGLEESMERVEQRMAVAIERVHSHNGMCTCRGWHDPHPFHVGSPTTVGSIRKA